MDRSTNASPPSAVHLGENIAHRACAHCRSQKVRCLPDEQHPDICQRCARSGRPCVFTPLQKRRQRKRTDTRVAELEREMRMMRALLKEKNEAEHDSDGPDLRPSPPGHDSYGAEGSSSQDVQRNPKDPRSDSLWRAYNTVAYPYTGTGSDASATTHQMLLTAHQEPDVIDKGWLSMEMAAAFLELYRTEYFTLYPMVAIPPSMTAHDLRVQRPILFLAVLATVADRDNAELSAKLDQELVLTLASRSLVQSQKSLELVQALLLSVVWYHPPQNTGQLKYYEYAHMAATMALDIGIGTRAIPHKSRAARKSTASQAMLHSLTTASGSNSAWATQRNMGSESQPDAVECRRTFISCYILCAIVSLSLRRPNMLRVSSYIKECLDYLENAPDTIPTDFGLAAVARLCIIGEDICVAFALDDPDNIASIGDLRCQIMLKAFEKRLTAWLDNTSEAHNNPCLMVMYHQIRLFAFELALYVEHSPEDFKAPYEIGRIHESDEEVPSQLLAEAVAECIAAAHGACNAITSCDSSRVRAMPGFTYIRVCFGAFILTKLSLSACYPHSQIGSVLDRSSLKAAHTLDRLITHLTQGAGPQKSKVLAIMLVLLLKMREWALHPENLMEEKQWSSDHAREQHHDRSYQPPGLQGSRVEQMSSTDSSPHSNDQGKDSASSKSPASLNQMAAMPSSYQAMPASHMQPTSMPPPQASPAPQMLGNYHTQPHPQMNYVHNTPSMIPDPDLMQLWDDVSRALPEGGLSGLEDWTGMSFAATTDTWEGYPSFNNPGFGRHNPA